MLHVVVACMCTAKIKSKTTKQHFVDPFIFLIQTHIHTHIRIYICTVKFVDVEYLYK